MTISAIVLAITGVFGGIGGGTGGYPSKDEVILKKWLDRLVDALKRLAGKAVEALPAIVGSDVDAILSFLGRLLDLLLNIHGDFNCFCCRTCWWVVESEGTEEVRQN